MRLSPVIYEHAARCAGLSPWAASREASALADAHLAAWQIYRHNPVTVGIDLYNPEPEAWGAHVAEPPPGAVPVIDYHPFTDIASLTDLSPLDPARAGRLPLILAAARQVRAALPPEVAVTVPIQGPVSCAAGLLGLEALMVAALDDPAALEAGLLHLAAMLGPWVAALTAAGVGLTVFDSAAAPPMLSPRMFRRVAAKPLAALIADITRVAGRPPFLVVGGEIAPIVGDLAASGCGGMIIPAETDQARCLAALAERPDLLLRINLSVGAVVSGDESVFQAALTAGGALAATRPGSLLGTGVLPWDADPTGLAARLLRC